VLVPFNILLCHLIGDFAFFNVYSKDNSNKKNFIKHVIWITALFLIINFDIILSIRGFLAVIIALSIHLLLDYIRTKKETKFTLEIIFLSFFIILSLSFKELFLDSFITPVFQFYLLGLVTATGVISFIFRSIKILEKEKKDTVGATERMVFFIFLMASNFIALAISIVLGIIYKILFEKRKIDKEMIFSPVFAVIISIIWYILI